jgi:uncharacterized membrane protein required for colicin V production
MIFAAAPAAATGKMLFNWFDVALVGIVIFGFWRGRKHGMSKEFVPLVQWLVTIFSGAFGYQPLGDELIRLGVIRDVFQQNFVELTAAYFSAYLIIAFVVAVIFSTFKRKAKAKLEGSTMFGGGEYYLGIMSGVLRYFCLVIFLLALLNAPVYTLADQIRMKQFNNKWFGGGMQGFSGDFFPTPAEVQSSVFKESLCGPFIKNQLSILLVNTAPPDYKLKAGGGTTEIILKQPQPAR